MSQPSSRHAFRGLCAALVTYVLWGTLPIYWRVVHGVAAPEKLAWRIVSSALLVMVLVRLRGVRAAGLALRRSRRTRWAGSAAAVVLAANWLIYIWGVQVGQIMEACLGYYICPLMSMALGAAVLGERMRRLQQLAGALAACGVGILIWHQGQWPVFGIALASTFALYSLLKKMAGLRGVEGFVVETLIMAPVALLYLLVAAFRGTLDIGSAPALSQGLLLGSGMISSIPLVLFGIAAESLALSTLGVLQFLAPTIALGVATWLYGEVLTVAHWQSFGLIWAGVALYAIDLRMALDFGPKARAPAATRAPSN